MEQTRLLPPESAVRLVWARTSAFAISAKSKKSKKKKPKKSTCSIWPVVINIRRDTAKDEKSKKSKSKKPKKSSYLIGPVLREIKKEAAETEEEGEKEREYAFQATAAMESSFRNLHVIYKWRNLNFDQNRELRYASFKLIKAYMEFGTKARDYFISLPATLVGSTGGVSISQSFGLSEIQSWLVVLTLSLSGFIGGHLINLKIIKHMCARKQELYIRMDYEESIYYAFYVVQVEKILDHLYSTMDRIHEKIFGQRYSTDEERDKIIKEIILEMKPRFCRYAHKHMSEDLHILKSRTKIIAGRWPGCETGIGDVTEKCKYWEGENKPLETTEV